MFGITQKDYPITHHEKVRSSYYPEHEGEFLLC